MSSSSNSSKNTIMKRLQGLVVGIVGTVIVGFNFGGWTLESSAAKLAEDDSRNAVIAAMAPVCASNFKKSADVATHMAELKDKTPYQRATYVEEGGWSTFAGNADAISGVGKACADMIMEKS